MTRKEELIELFLCGEMGQVEFLERALDLPDFSVEQIGKVLVQSEEDLGDFDWRHGL